MDLRSGNYEQQHECSLLRQQLTPKAGGSFRPKIQSAAQS
jgi:hypothetical protein